MASGLLDDLLAQAIAGLRLRIATLYDLTVGPGWGFSGRRNRDWHLLAVLDGRGRYEVCGAHVPLIPGTVVLVGPGARHSARPDPRRLPCIIAIRFEAVQADGTSWQGRPHAVHDILPNDVALLRQIADLHGGGALADLRQHGLLIELFARMRCRNGIGELEEPAPLERLCRQLRSQPVRRWGVAAMARDVGLSEKHFIRAFRAHTGTTPHGYLVRARLDQACFLLGENGVGIAEVADQLGYPDQAAFTRQFTRVIGLPPSRWRAAHRGDGG
jgi:AraC-like DNA-binding protein